LLDAIDGEITGYTWNNFGGVDMNYGGGRIIRQRGLALNFTTSTGVYYMSIMYEWQNSFQPEEMGIRNVGLMDPNDVILGRITATNGVGDWHE